ncbi:MAG TPA: hypothetical protein VGO93_26720 [Candidatus Xenobia bacterium]|jgi:hypothetical protein
MIDEATFPANARLITVRFGEASLKIAIDPGGECDVPAMNVQSLHGARIRREHTKVTGGKGAGGAAIKVVGSLALTAVTGIPMSVGGKSKGKEGPQTKEEIQYALGMRVTGVAEVWFLINTSFNFRQSLGPEAGYAAEINLRTFTRKLAEVCTEARQDDFFTAVVEGTGLPPPIDSLMEFFRQTQR